MCCTDFGVFQLLHQLACLQAILFEVRNAKERHAFYIQSALDEFFSNKDITAAVTAAQQLCWRNSKISCLSLQIVVSTHCSGCVTCDRAAASGAEISKWNSPMVSELFLRGLALQ